MNKNIECEERVMISEDDYSKIMNDYSSISSFSIMEQINYYFDDEDLSLRNAHRVLRMRIINNEIFELCMKIKGNDGDIELNQIVDKEEAEHIIATSTFKNEEINKRIKEVTSKEIKLITHLYTKRAEVEIDNHLLVIDKNDYSGVTDYDIEVEAPTMKEAKEAIEYYCHKYHLIYNKKYVSKSRRAINRALGIS